MPELLKSISKLFSMFLNEHGEVANGEPENPNPEDNEQAGDEGNQDPNATAKQQIDWENEANPYRKRYADSQSQVQPLVRTLQQFAEYDHTTKQWKPKTQATPVSSQTDDIDKLLEGYDPEFRKVLAGYTERQIRNILAERDKQSQFVSEYTSGVEKSRSTAIAEFGTEFDFAKDGKMNVNSPLYKLANEIVTNKYAQFNPDGSFIRYSTPDAEYLATVEAYAILSKKAKTQPPADKGKLGAINGKGSKAGSVGKKLSPEEYLKLSDADKDAYDLSQMGG